MALYSGAGDAGVTRLPGEGGAPIRKDDARCVALGTVDELNAAIGLCLAEARRADHALIFQALSSMQDELLAVGAVLAAVCAGQKPPARLDPSAAARMEKDIDRICEQLPELTHFILPCGCELASRLHLARTMARRAERAVAGVLAAASGDDSATILKYMNRISDLLFALARLANHDAGEGDVIWQP